MWRVLMQVSTQQVACLSLLLKNHNKTTMVDVEGRSCFCVLCSKPEARLDEGIYAEHGFEKLMQKQTRESLWLASQKIQQAISGIIAFFTAFQSFFRDKVLQAPGIHVPCDVLEACSVCSLGPDLRFFVKGEDLNSLPKCE